jgi:nucleolar protein 14
LLGSECGDFFPLFCQRHHEKKSIYNLNEDEELTHYGQSLADIEKHNDIVDSDSDTEERGTLSGKVGGVATQA